MFLILLLRVKDKKRKSRYVCIVTLSREIQSIFSHHFELFRPTVHLRTLVQITLIRNIRSYLIRETPRVERNGKVLKLTRKCPSSRGFWINIYFQHPLPFVWQLNFRIFLTSVIWLPNFNEFLFKYFWNFEVSNQWILNSSNNTPRLHAQNVQLTLYFVYKLLNTYVGST